MNKAQKKFVADFYANYYNLVITYDLIIKFTNGFTAIDPTPDTKKYVVRLAGGINNDYATVNGVQYETKELAAQHIQRFVRDHMFEGSYKILSYNGQLEEVRYSMYEGGIVYKRWVEEVE